MRSLWWAVRVAWSRQQALTKGSSMLIQQSGATPTGLATSLLPSMCKLAHARMQELCVHAMEGPG